MNTLNPISVKALQTRITDITPEEVRALSSFQHYTDEEVDLLIQTIKTFTQIGYAVFSKQPEAGEGKLVSLFVDTNQKNAA